ncbi:MAG: cation:proton antiporter [Gemmatimonadota bacterium]
MRLRMVFSYLLLVFVPLAGTVAVLRYGSDMQSSAALRIAPTAVPPLAQANLKLSVLLLQVLIIVVASRAVGALLRRFKQPQVIGEMLAGILLGQSFLGTIAPGVYDILFPTGSLRFLNALSQIGLLLFMFLVGLELDPKLLRGRGETALLTSHTSIAAPIFLGTSLALFLYPRLSDGGASFIAFALFLGAAMSVTAFPVLARILSEKQLHKTHLGSVVIACAAVDDVTAWCMLAVVVAIARAGSATMPLWATIGGAMLFAAFVLGVMKPALGWLYNRFTSRGTLSFQDLIAMVLAVVLACAWTTERLGVHALFGAFLAGTAMPKDPVFVKGVVRRFEDVMVTLLLPLFFAYTGLRMNIGLLAGAGSWLVCLLVIGTAIAGKFGGSAIAARVTGLSWQQAWMVGALMNTRGLMELVILNVGLDLGVISRTLFTMMVLMALVTTFMTTPLLEYFGVSSMRQQGDDPASPLGTDSERSVLAHD